MKALAFVITLDGGMVMRLEHVNMTVSNVRRSARFYGDLLGLTVRWEGKTSQGWPAIHIGDETSYLALFQSPSPSRAPEDYDQVGLNHFGFVVDDLDSARKRLAELGVTPKAEHDYEPGKRLYFYDPDGIEVELVEYDMTASDCRVFEKDSGGVR